MIKITLELPEFEKELNVSVSLKKDGEVIYTSSSSPEVKTEVEGEVWKQIPPEENVISAPSKKKTTKKGGNLMDISL